MNRFAHIPMTRVAAGALAAVCFCPTATLAGSYRFTQVLAGSQITGINNAGQATGVRFEETPEHLPVWNGFVYSGGQIQYLGQGFVPNGINALGQVAGGFYDANVGAYDHPFLYSNGTVTSLPTSGQAYAGAINDSGTVVGETAQGADPPFLHAFRYANGTMIDISAQTSHQYVDAAGVPTKTQFLSPHGINSLGQIAGKLSTDVVEFPDVDPNYWQETSSQAAIYDNGVVKRLQIGTTSGGTPMYLDGQALAINDRGDVLARTQYGNMIWNAGKITQSIGSLPGGAPVTANAMNGLGQVVGTAPTTLDPNGPAHAFVYQNGTVDLNTLVDSSAAGYTLQSATCVNDLGQIGGFASSRTTTASIAFILTPVSDPAQTGSLPVGAGSGQTTPYVGGYGAQFPPSDPRHQDTTGGVAASFASTTGGTFDVAYDDSLAPADLLDSNSPFHAGTATFTLPGTGPFLQAWDLHLDGGTFSGTTRLTFHYSDADLAAGTDERQLLIYHWNGSAWEVLPNEVVDPLNNTISVDATSFSPFALGEEPTPVPEPASLGATAGGVLGLALGRCRRRRPRQRRRCAAAHV